MNHVTLQNTFIHFNLICHTCFCFFCNKILSFFCRTPQITKKNECHQWFWWVVISTYFPLRCLFLFFYWLFSFNHFFLFSLCHVFALWNVHKEQNKNSHTKTKINNKKKNKKNCFTEVAMQLNAKTQMQTKNAINTIDNAAWKNENKGLFLIGVFHSHFRLNIYTHINNK